MTTPLKGGNRFAGVGTESMILSEYHRQMLAASSLAEKVQVQTEAVERLLQIRESGNGQ